MKVTDNDALKRKSKGLLGFSGACWSANESGIQKYLHEIIHPRALMDTVRKARIATL